MDNGSAVSLSRDVAGHIGPGQEPVGGAYAPFGGQQKSGLMNVYSRGAQHAAAGRIGEAGEPVTAHTAGERPPRGDLRLTGRRALVRATARQQVLAGSRRGLRRG